MDINDAGGAVNPVIQVREGDGPAIIRKAAISSPPLLPGPLGAHTTTVSYSAAPHVADLVPVRLDFSVGTQFRFLDSFTWNLAENELTPEQFAEVLCAELELPEKWEGLISGSIRRQINLHQQQRQLHAQLDASPVPNVLDESLFFVRLNLTVNGVTLHDQFEWSLENPRETPEAFAKTTCADLGLSREFEVAISHSIREQIQFYRNAVVSAGGNTSQQLSTSSPLAIKRGGAAILKFYNRPLPVQPRDALRRPSDLVMWTPIVGVGPGVQQSTVPAQVSGTGTMNALHAAASLVADPTKNQRRLAESAAILPSPYELLRAKKKKLFSDSVPSAAAPDGNALWSAREQSLSISESLSEDITIPSSTESASKVQQTLSGHE